MYLLEEIWRGNVSPGERFIRRDSEYQKITKKSSDLMDQLTEDLSPKANELLETFLDQNNAMHCISEEDAFVQGVRFGAKFILDVISEYHSQLPSSNE